MTRTTMIPKHIRNHSHPHRNRHYYGCHCHHHDGQLSWLSLWWLSWAESPSPSSSSLQISSGKRYHKSLGKWMTEPIGVILYSLWIYRGRPALFPSCCREMPKRKARQNGPKKFQWSLFNRCGSARVRLFPTGNCCVKCYKVISG